MSGAWPAFWHLLTWVCVAWYTFLTLYVAWRGQSDIRGMLDRLKAAGVQLINETPLAGSGGKQYAFVHPKSANGVMVELYQLPK